MTLCPQIPAFPKIFTLGHRATENIFNGPVEITEKIDGSQFSFGKINGELIIRSKSVRIMPETCDSMFKLGVEYVLSIQDKLKTDVVYHGEYLRTPNHNTLTYGRVPENHFMLFGARDINLDRFVYKWETLAEFAEEILCEPIPLICKTELDYSNYYDFCIRCLNTQSELDGTLIEGIVVKNYAHDMLIGEQYIPITCGKFVSESFKEKHKVSWSSSNPGNMQKLANAISTEPRWEKAVQTLRDRGELAADVKDIGPLLKCLNQDVIEEEIDEIKDMLWGIFRKEVLRHVSRGLPDWYKKKLLKGLEK